MANVPHSERRPSVAFLLLCAFLLILWLAGGASRADALGQAVVRGSATVVLVLALLFGKWRVQPGCRAVWLLVIATIVLVVLQLVPLPPAMWQALPGRRLFADAIQLTGAPQPWRPLSISPSLTVNSAASLLVPLATLVLASNLRERERTRVPALVLAMISATMLFGLLQLSGSGIANPLINYVGQVSGNFANRNHFALLLAMGCVVAPTWALQGARDVRWRIPLALGLVLLFLLMILASGSRAGLGGGGLALLTSLVLARHDLKRRFGAASKWARLGLIAAPVSILFLFVGISVFFNRAAAINRLLELDSGQDLRTLALPAVLSATSAFFPFGTGFGTFDPAFRIFEPDRLLSLFYFNQAHNDLLSLVLEGGAPALILLAVAVFWWVRTSVSALRSPQGSGGRLRLTGSTIILLAVLASAFDYPVRTPIIMAVLVLAALWLADRYPAPAARFTPGEAQPIARHPRS